MRDAARREPTLAGTLRKALQSYTPFYRPPDHPLHELASALHSACCSPISPCVTTWSR
jgi:hypothetical protein